MAASSKQQSRSRTQTERHAKKWSAGHVIVVNNRVLMGAIPDEKLDEVMRLAPKTWRAVPARESSGYLLSHDRPSEVARSENANTLARMLMEWGA